MQTDLANTWTGRAELALEQTPLERTQLIAPGRGRRSVGKPPLPARNPGLKALLEDAQVVCSARARVAERQRLLLVAHPALAECYEVPPSILAAAGLASGDPELPPEGIADAD